MSNTHGKIITNYVTACLNSKPINRIHGKTNLVSYSLLINQLALKANSVKTKQYGGKHGNLPLIINDAKFRIISGVATATTDKTATPTGMDLDIDKQKLNFQRQKITGILKVKILTTLSRTN